MSPLEVFLDVLSRYARAYAVMCEHIHAGKTQEAFIQAQEAISLAHKLDEVASQVKCLPDSLMPYEGWHGELAMQFRSGQIMIEGKRVPFGFSVESLGLGAR